MFLFKVHSNTAFSTKFKCALALQSLFLAITQTTLLGLVYSKNTSDILFSLNIFRNPDMFVSSSIVQDGLGVLLLHYVISFVARVPGIRYDKHC